MPAEATAIKSAIAFAIAMTLGSTAAASGAPARIDPRTIPLVDQHGSAFTLRDLAGKPTLVTFVATRCTDTCPIANAVFFNLEKKLHADHVDAQLLTVTLDPGYDTPYVFASAARSFAADARYWRFASGRAIDVHRLMASLGVTTTADEHGIPEAHSTVAFVLDTHVRLTKTMLLSSTLVDDGERALKSTK